MAKQVNILERTETSTGVILYKVLSSDNTTEYYVTINGSEVFCECKGFEYGKCYHSRDLVAAECEKQAEAKLAAYREGMAAQYSAAPSSFEKPAGLAESYQSCWYPKSMRQ